MHFRVFFLAPWALYAAFLVVKDRAWRQWTRRAVPALVVAVGCATTSLYVFWLDLPSLRSSGVNTRLRLLHPQRQLHGLGNALLLGYRLDLRPVRAFERFQGTHVLPLKFPRPRCLG